MDNNYKNFKLAIFFKSLTFQKALTYLLVAFACTLGTYQMRKESAPPNFLQNIFFLTGLLFFAIFWFSRLNLTLVESIKELFSSLKNKVNRPPSYRDLIDDIDDVPDLDSTKDLTLQKEARQKAALFSSLLFFILSFFV